MFGATCGSPVSPGESLPENKANREHRAKKWKDRSDGGRKGVFIELRDPPELKDIPKFFSFHFFKLWFELAFCHLQSKALSPTRIFPLHELSPGTLQQLIKEISWLLLPESYMEKDVELNLNKGVPGAQRQAIRGTCENTYPSVGKGAISSLLERKQACSSSLGDGSLTMGPREIVAGTG